MKSFESTPLMKNERDVIEAAVRMLKSEFSVANIILFGSKAHGDHDEHSNKWENGIFTEFPVYQEISQDGAVVL